MAQLLCGLMGCPKSLACYTFYHKVIQMGSSLNMLDTHCCNQNLPNEGSLLILMAYPSHTSSTYLQSLDLPSLFVHLTQGDMLC
jgi:hypothetical protein